MRKAAETKDSQVNVNGRQFDAVVNSLGASSSKSVSTSESMYQHGFKNEEPKAGGDQSSSSRPFAAGDVMSDEKNEKDMWQEMAARMQDTGILPLTIRLPKSGTRHAFNRLMTAQEALELNVTYVNLPVTILPFVSVGMLLLGSISGLAWAKFLR